MFWSTQYFFRYFRRSTRGAVLLSRATKAVLVYLQPRLRLLLWGYSPVMQIQWNERDGAALRGAGLRLMKLQTCGLLHQQNEAPSGFNISTMIRLLGLKSMTLRSNLPKVSRKYISERVCSFNHVWSNILFFVGSRKHFCLNESVLELNPD